MTNATLRGKPDTGNPHVRFDEGEVAPAEPRRGALLHNIKHYRAIGGFALMLFLTGCIAVSHRLVNPSLKPVDNLASKGVKFYVKNFKLTSTYMNDFMWRDFNSEGKSLLTSKYPTLFSFSDKDAVELEIHIAHNRTEELKPIHNMLALLNGTVILPFVKKYNHAFSVEAVIGTSATGYERAEYRFFTRQLAAQNIIPFWMFCYPFAEQDGSFYHDFYGKNILSNKEFTDAVLQVLTEFSPETLAAIRTGLPIRPEQSPAIPATKTVGKSSPPAAAPQSAAGSGLSLFMTKSVVEGGDDPVYAFIPKDADDDELFAIILDANAIRPPSSAVNRSGSQYNYADQKASDAASKLVAAMQKMTGKNVELVFKQIDEQGAHFNKTAIPNPILKENVSISAPLKPSSENEYDLVGECMKVLVTDALSDKIRKRAFDFLESRKKSKTAVVAVSEQTATSVTNQQDTTTSNKPADTSATTPQKRPPAKEIIAVTSMGFDRKTGEGASLVGLTVSLGDMGICNKTGKSGWNGVNTTGIYTNMSGDVQTLTLKDVSFWVNGNGANWWDLEIGEVVDSKGESVQVECISAKDEKGDGRIALMVDRCYRLVPCGNTLNSIHFVQPSLPADRLTHIFKKLWPYFTLSFQGSEMVKPAEDTQIENVKAWLSDGFKPNDWKVTGFFVPDKDSSPSEQHRLVGSSCGYVVPISDTLKGISLIEYCQANNYNKLLELFKSASPPVESTMQGSHSGTVQQSAGEAQQLGNQKQDGEPDGSAPKPSLKADESTMKAVSTGDQQLAGACFTARERAIGQLKPDYAQGSLAFAPDGTRFAYACGSQGRQRIITGDSAGETAVFCSVPQFSPVSNELYYFTTRKAASGQLAVDLIAGDKKIPTDFKPGHGYLEFSADGKRYAAIGARMFEAGHATKTGGVSVMIDGRAIGIYKDVTSPAFSPDGNSYAFSALNNDETMSLVVDGKVQRTFKKPEQPCSFIFKPSLSGPNLDGMVKVHFMSNGCLAYIVSDEQGWSVYMDGKRVASYGLVIWGGPGGSIHILAYDGADKDPAIMVNSFVAAERAGTIAWWARSGGDGSGWSVLVNGESKDKLLWNNNSQRIPPKLSMDGKHLAYVAEHRSESGSQEYYTIHDNKKHGPYDDVWALAMSDDGNCVAYAARAKGTKLWSGYVDGKKFGEDFNRLYGTQIAAKGMPVAWCGVRDGKEFAVVNGVPLASGDEILFGPFFGADKCAKWIMRRGSDLVEVVAIPR